MGIEPSPSKPRRNKVLPGTPRANCCQSQNGGSSGSLGRDSSCVDQLPSFQSGKRLDGLSRPLLSEPQVVEALQIHPKLSTRAKEMGEAQGRVPRDGTRSV